MKVRLKHNLLVITAESDDEREILSAWARGADGHVFALKHQDEQTFRMTALGPRAEACREPINVTSRAADPAVQLISNFAHTPFELDGRCFASVEGFWQGLKFPDETRRQDVALLHGDAARRSGFDAPAGDVIEYRGRTVRAGTADHWRLMAVACWAKFTQHNPARDALLGTGDRPLIHKTRRDSRTIPGVVMADIWTKIRRGLVKRKGSIDLDDPEADDGADAAADYDREAGAS